MAGEKEQNTRDNEGRYQALKRLALLVMVLAAMGFIWQLRAIVDPNDATGKRSNQKSQGQSFDPDERIAGDFDANAPLETPAAPSSEVSGQTAGDTNKVGGSAEPGSGAPDSANKPAQALAQSSNDEPRPKYNWRLGLVTGTNFQSSDIQPAVELAIKRFGKASEGGLIRHLTYPDNFLAEIDKTIEVIESLVHDPMVKVILVIDGVPGTVEAFNRIRQKRPDMILLVTEIHESLAAVAEKADIVVGADFLSRSYLIPYAAKKLGARSLVHVSFPRHMIDESLRRSRDIMELACEDLGLDFYYENSPDPTGEKGLKRAQDFIYERIPIWLEKYGPDTAFYATNNAHTAPMIKGIIENGGYFVEAQESSPLMGYPEALGLDFSQYFDDWPRIVQEIEKAIIEKGASGRLGSWVSSTNMTHILALVDFGVLVVTGQVERRDLKALKKSYQDVNPAIKWTGAIYADSSLKEIENFLLIYQDTYIFGKGFLGLTTIEVPMKYKTYKKG
jgi:hypothetical protein